MKATPWSEIKFEFRIVDQELRLDITVDDIDVDLDWEYFVLPVIAGGFIGFIGGIIGGFVGLAIGGAIGAGAIMGVEEYFLDYGEQKIKESVEDTITDVAPLSTIPRRVSLVRKRWDPFYYIHHQLLNGFDYCDVREEGIFASGFVGSVGTGDETYPYINLIGSTRDRDGNLVDLIYEVEDPEEIALPEACRRREGAPPNEFIMSPMEAKERVRRGHLRRKLFVHPTHVYRRDNQIRYLLFNTGLALTPHEAGDLELGDVLQVTGGYRRIYRRGRFYYRTRADITEVNNLGNMPPFDPKEVFMPAAEG